MKHIVSCVFAGIILGTLFLGFFDSWLTTLKNVLSKNRDYLKEIQNKKKGDGNR